VLRIAYVDGAYRPAIVEDALGKLDVDVVVGPEWARSLSAGRVFIPTGKEKFLEWIKDAHVRETLGTGLVDEVRI
jgi:hypothetical protein